MAEEYSNVAQLFSELATRLRSFPVPNASNSPNQTNNSNSVTQTTPIPNVLNSSTNSVNETAVVTASRASTSSRTHNELQTLFPHHFTSTSSQRNTSGSSSRKRRKNNQHNGKNNKKSNVKCLTRKFVCLSDKDQQEVPEREEMRELLVHGLGEIKVAIPEDANEKAIRDILIESFPKLKDSGGFELMYTECRKKDLSVIPPGPDGISMKYLASFIAQGKIYVRPIQQDLSIEEDEVEAVEVEKEQCMNCCLMVDIHLLREHHQICTEDEIQPTGTTVF
ncbi:Hypothetical predicted protein [Paramuricea clavata]|uniref:Uncharacterized protein n=1 Tax=Paramuricea clavata TaxID=317549 RepID=A0A7D9IVD6_PARCT|nr:Hypothetical predicted protein [Paramuricea clavata]